MSGDEVVVLIGAGIVSLVCWAAWYIAPLSVVRPARRVTVDLLLYLTPPLAMALLYVVLRTASAYDARDDPRYLAFYLVLGAAWIGLWVRWIACTGISARDDAVERGNRSAATVVSGAILAIASCYAGGNIGDGPGWWVVVFSAALATAALFAFWIMLETISGVSDVVTIDRDPAAGVRLAGLLIAVGLVLGRSVAGDWISAKATVADFAATAWPAAILVAVAAIIERWFRPTPDNVRPNAVIYGVVPAVLYVSAAIYQVLQFELPA